MDVREQRVRFVVAANRREKSLAELCREFGISRPAGYEWLKRYRRAEWRDRGRQPAAAAQSAANEREGGTAGGGAAAALSGLGMRASCRCCCSARASSWRAIRFIAFCCGMIWCIPKTDMSRRWSASSAGAPNELWQMDFKGPKRWHQPVGPLSVLDDHSRYLIVLHAVPSTHTEQVREQLEAAFCERGVPEAMLMDHGTPWWSVRSAGGMTKLSLWLMRQGIGLHWSRMRHPQTQGKVERFHGELQRALARRRVLVPDAQLWLDEFRWEHNHVRPARGAGHADPGQPLASEYAGAMIPTRRDGNIRRERGC